MDKRIIRLIGKYIDNELIRVFWLFNKWNRIKLIVWNKNQTIF